jgi:hypothetical protein
VADEGPVALPDFGGAELGFEQVGIEEGVSVPEAFEQAGPLGDGLTDRGAELSLEEGHVDDPIVEIGLERFGDVKEPASV